MRVRTGDSSDAKSLLIELKELWPLAKTAVVTNQLDGAIEAQIVIPRECDEYVHARMRASSSICAEVMRKSGFILLMVGVSMYLHDIFDPQSLK